MTTTYKKVFWAAGFGWMFDAMDVALLSFIMVALRQEWGLTGEEAGLLGTGNLVGMAIGAMLGGYLADRIGRKPVFLYTLILFGAASLASAFATGFLAMLLLRFCMGLGLGAELPVASTLVNEFAPPEKRGRTVVLLESFWAVGWLIAAVIAYFIIPDYGWRMAVILGALPILYAFFVRKNIPESPQYKPQTERIPVQKLLTEHKRETITLWVVWFAIAFSYYGMFLWMPSVLVDKGFTMIQSFQYVLIMTLAQLPGYFAAAYLVENWGRKQTLATFLFMTAVLAYAFGESSGTASLLITGAFLVTKDKEVIGPLNEDLKAFHLKSEDRTVLHVAEETGISVATINKLVAFIRLRRDNRFTATDLAAYLQVSRRSAERILKKLADKEFVRAVGEEQPYQQGRPRALYRINF